MASTTDSLELGSIPTTLRERWGWLLAFGIAQIIAGVLAIAVPPAASLAAVLIFGWATDVSAVLSCRPCLQGKEVGRASRCTFSAACCMRQPVSWCSYFHSVEHLR